MKNDLVSAIMVTKNNKINLIKTDKWWEIFNQQQKGLG
jgi:hypothetical protein